MASGLSLGLLVSADPIEAALVAGEDIPATRVAAKRSLLVVDEAAATGPSGG